MPDYGTIGRYPSDATSTRKTPKPLPKNAPARALTKTTMNKIEKKEFAPMKKIENAQTRRAARQRMSEDIERRYMGKRS